MKINLNIDFELLREQYMLLCDMQANPGTYNLSKKGLSKISGLVELIETILITEHTS